MKKSFTTSLMLCAFLAGLVAWYFIYEKKIKPDHEKAEEQSKQLITVERDQIQTVKIERLKNVPESGQVSPTTPDYTTVALKKSGQDWILISPIEDGADGGVVTGMLSTLVAAKQDRIVDEQPKDLEPFGLKAPLLKITVTKDGATAPQVILIGKDTPVGSSSYVRVGDTGPIMRVPQTLKSSFDKDAKSIRNKEILKFTRFEVSEAEVQNAKSNIVVKKGDKDQWTLLRENAPADSNEWGKTLNAATDLRAKDFVTEKTNDLGQYGLKTPAIKVTLKRAKEPTKVEVWLGIVKDKAYAKRTDKDTIYEVDPETIKPLQRSVDELRDMRLSQFNRFDIGHIKIDRAKDSLELRKNGTLWTVPNDETKLDAARIDAWLTHLQDVKVVKYLNPSAAVKQPALTVHVFEIKNNAETEVLTLEFANPTGKAVTGQRKGSNSPFVLKEDDWKKINLTKSDLLQLPGKPAEPKKPDEKKP